MREHLSEDKLIKYELKLLSDKQLRNAAVHLAACDSCREQHKKLKGKYAGLELLREEVGASEELIHRTLGQLGEASSEVRGPRSYFARKGWMAAAAGLAILIGGLLVMQWGPRTPDERSIESTEVSEKEGLSDIQRQIAENIVGELKLKISPELPTNMSAKSFMSLTPRNW